MAIGPNLINESCEKESNLHEHEVSSWIEVCKAHKGEIVVETIESSRDKVKKEDPTVDEDAV